jgi:hypothetical protein
MKIQHLSRLGTSWKPLLHESAFMRRIPRKAETAGKLNHRPFRRRSPEPESERAVKSRTARQTAQTVLCCLLFRGLRLCKPLTEHIEP